ncbi:hypothetical protein RND81_13G127900 [Saponaria officinalis]|uniref:B box-type domain-containing protein n=1 Tax=Saponaria officinalis TaxID=3572 RepID=A0AAW1H2S6_SAPOF
MNTQCNMCETAEATVLCCADEAALCDSCDRKVHAANKLARFWFGFRHLPVRCLICCFYGMLCCFYRSKG